MTDPTNKIKILAILQLVAKSYHKPPHKDGAPGHLD